MKKTDAQKARDREKYAARTDEQKAKAKLYHQKRLAENRQKIGDYRREWRKRNKERLQAHWRKYALQKNYGLSLEQFDAMLAAQGGVCKIRSGMNYSGGAL